MPEEASSRRSLADEAAEATAGAEASPDAIAAIARKLDEGLSEHELENIQTVFKSIGTARDWRRAVAQNAELLLKVAALIA